MNRDSVFRELEDWFVFQRRKGEENWAEVVAKHSADPLFGRHLHWAGHGGEVEVPVLGSITGPLHWCHDGPWLPKDTFYFNCIGRDLRAREFEQIKDALQALLGRPDEVFSYWGLSEPTWTNGRSQVRLYHIPTHGSGYERVEVSTDSKWLRSG